MKREVEAHEYIAPEGTGEVYQPLFNTAADFLPAPRKCSTIIDLGCGTGWFAKVLFDRGYTRYIGIDFSPAMIEKARKLLPKATFIIGDLRSKETQKVIQKYNTFVTLETLSI